MTRSETLGVVASGAFGPAILALYLLRILTADLAFAVIGFSFAVALIPGVIENQRKRIGWSKRSCIMTGNNLFAFTVIFLTLGLPLTAVSEFVSASMWTVLLVQAFIYAKPKTVDPIVVKLEFLKTHGHGEYHEEGLERCEACVTHRFLGLQPPLFWEPEFKIYD